MTATMGARTSSTMRTKVRASMQCTKGGAPALCIFVYMRARGCVHLCVCRVGMRAVCISMCVAV